MGSKRKILIGLIAKNKVTWKKTIKEMDRYGIEEIALFVEFLKIKDRKELYKDIELSAIKAISHVHLKDDMEKWELDFFNKKYKTQVFNIHPDRGGFKLVKKYKKFRSMIFVENKQCPVNSKLFEINFFKKHNVAGICLDLAHLEGQRLNYHENYLKTIDVLEQFPMGCNHVSGLLKKPRKVRCLGLMQDLHSIKSTTDLSYLKRMPKKYFSNIISIELDNSVKDQIKYKKYIENIINSKK